MFATRQEGAVRWTEFSNPWSEEDGQAYLSSLRTLGDLAGAFVLVTVIEEEMVPLPPEQRREQALIFKKLKPHLQAHCLGMVRVRPAGTQADDETMSRGFGWPVVTVASREEGRARAAAFLAALS